MKTQKISIYLFLISALMFSCDELDELTEFDVDAGFNTTINVNIEEQTDGDDSSATLSETAVIDISDNQDIADNFDLIENVSITSLTYKIINYLGDDDATITNASITFGSTTIDIDDINLKNADESNTVYEIENTSQLGTIGNFLENNPVINIVLNGTVSSTPVQFDIRVNLETNVTIDAV